jgi:hypothetical protein
MCCTRASLFRPTAKCDEAEKERKQFFLKKRTKKLLDMAAAPRMVKQRPSMGSTYL